MDETRNRIQGCKMTRARLLPTLVFVALGMFVFVPVGCSQTTVLRSPSDSSSASRPGSVTATPHDQVPIVYDERLKPHCLSQVRVDGILANAERLMPPGQSVWYIHVSCNLSTECGGFVYYTPDVTERRIRKGFRVSFQWYGRRPGSPGDPQNCDVGPLLRYVQVSLAGQPFETKTEAPIRALWPFGQPDGFSDDDIIALVDLARKGFDASEVLADGSPNQPIYKIFREEEAVVIWTGSMQRPLAGAGDSIGCIKKHGRWFIIWTSSWLS